MGLRIAAVVAAIAIAIVVVAAFIAGRSGFVGSAPAGPDPNVKAYQAMVSSDSDAMNTAISKLSCNSIQDNNCRTTRDVAVPVDQKWVVDLTAFRTPARFAAIDGQLRAHLNQTIAELNAVVASQAANNQNGFDLANEAVFYELAWLGPTVSAIEGTYPGAAGTYHDAFRITKQALDACVKGAPDPADIGCAALLLGKVCTGGVSRSCASETESAATRIQTFLIVLLQNPAPGSLTTKNEQLLADLGQADTALLVITDGLVNANAAKVASGQTSYGLSILAADRDAGAMGNP